MAERKCRHCKQMYQPRTQGQGFCSSKCNNAARQGKYPAQRKAALARDGYGCQECAATDALECHHIEPRAQGGTHALTNLQTLCRDHHKAKHRRHLAMTPPERAARKEIRRMYDPLALCYGLSEDMPDGPAQCDSTYRYTRAFFAEYAPDVDVDRYLALLAVLGGHCDCEIGLNVCARYVPGA